MGSSAPPHPGQLGRSSFYSLCWWLGRSPWTGAAPLMCAGPCLSLGIPRFQLLNTANNVGKDFFICISCFYFREISRIGLTGTSILIDVARLFSKGSKPHISWAMYTAFPLSPQQAQFLTLSNLMGSQIKWDHMVLSFTFPNCLLNLNIFCWLHFLPWTPVNLKKHTYCPFYSTWQDQQTIFR